MVVVVVGRGETEEGRRSTAALALVVEARHARVQRRTRALVISLSFSSWLGVVVGGMGWGG